MKEATKNRLKKLGLPESDFEPKPENKIVYISREDFNLLDATEVNTIYHIAEDNGTVTMIKGDNR